MDSISTRFSTLVGIATLALGVLAFSFAPLGMNVFAATDGQLNVLINGAPPSDFCVAGPITVSGDGVTGGQGGSWHLSIDWGDGVTTTDESGITTSGLDGQGNPFTYSQTRTLTSASTGITVILYHSQPSGEDGRVIDVNQCVAPPTQGVVVVKKDVVNDNGGQILAPGFTLHIDGNNFAGSETGADFTLDPAAYPVTEDAVSGYSQTSLVCTGDDSSSTTNGTVTVAAGHNYVCTVTNDDDVPAIGDLVITKTTDEGNGTFDFSGTGSIGDFQITTVGGVGSHTIIGLAATSYTISEDPSAHYTADLSGCGTDGVVTVATGATTTCTISNTYFNTPPVADDSLVTTDEDTPVSDSVSGTDTDGDSLFYAVLVGPLHGLLTSAIDSVTGAFTYTPDPDYNGPDSFTFSAFDGVASDEGEVTITVNPVNDDPVALADSYSTNEDTPVTTGDVLTNDTDADGDTLSVSAADSTSANGGTVVDNGDGTFDYTPALNFGGSDTFSYTVSDGNGGTDTAVVTITVSNDNDVPVATDDSYNTDEDVTLIEPANGVLGNDSDADSDPLTAVLDTDVSNGSLTLDADGGFSYDPDPDFNGTDSFTYHANDGTADSSEVTVTITVDPINDVPVATGESHSTPQNVPVPGIVDATDVDGDTLTYAVTTGPTNGTLTVFDTDTGAFTYTPNSNYTGSDSFTFTANDGLLDSNEATVDITITESPEDTLPLCSDGLDNDNDGLIDLNDPDCANFPLEISISPETAVNAVNQAHTFTVTLEQGSGTSTLVVGVPVTVTLSPSVEPTSDTCATGTDGDGECAVTINSSTPGTFTAHASTTIMSGGNPFPVATGGEDNPDATKEYVGAQIALSPLTATNDINQAHVITATIVVNPGPSETLAPDGQLVTFALDNSAGATAAFEGGVDTCTTSGGTGTCSVTINSATAGTVTVNGFVSIDVSGVTLERDTDPSTSAPAGPNGTGPALKTYVDDTTPPAPEEEGRTGGGGGRAACPDGTNYNSATRECEPDGQVLGAATSTPPTLGVTCGVYMDQYLRQGGPRNNPDQVTKLQQFLVKHGYGSFTPTGFFGPLTFASTKAFQGAYASTILAPWGLSVPTGLAYLTTLRQLNLIECPELMIPQPELVPWNLNPIVQ